jgi:hypothetical protein
MATGQPPLSPENLASLAALLQAMGCPPDKTREMAVMLDKRARQLAEQKGRTYEEALQHVLQLMRQGWAAREKGFS